MRKPAALEMAGGKGQRQTAWDRIRALHGRDFSLRDLAQADGSIDTLRDYVNGLERAGYLAITQQPKIGGVANRPKRWILARDVGVEAPRVRRDGSPVTQGLAQEQMWRTLRRLKGDTTARELAAHASTPEVPVSAVAAADYLYNLHHASYLECTRPAAPAARNGGQSQARYRLISNTGPRPPMVCRTDSLYDPNLDAVVWIRPVTDEEAIYGR